MLRFNLFGFPVRIMWTFWLVGVLLSAGSKFTGPEAPEIILGWVVALFISILWHELGHAFAFRKYGGYAEIVLYHFGGKAQSMVRLTRRQTMVVSAAGPVFGLLLGSAFYLLIRYGVITPPSDFQRPGTVFASTFLSGMLYINLFWSLVNCLPVYPLDGGQFLEAATGNRRRTLQVSYITGFAMAIASVFFFQSLYMALLFGILGYQSLMMYRGVPVQFPWQR